MRTSIEPEILVGWKAIAAVCGGYSTRTIRRKAAKHSMPVKYVDGRPQISRSKLIEWWDGLVDERKME